MNQCHDCIFYKTYWHSPPECINEERDGQLADSDEVCKQKISISEAKYLNREGL